MNRYEIHKKMTKKPLHIVDEHRHKNSLNDWIELQRDLHFMLRSAIGNHKQSFTVNFNCLPLFDEANPNNDTDDMVIIMKWFIGIKGQEGIITLKLSDIVKKTREEIIEYFKKLCPQQKAVGYE